MPLPPRLAGLLTALALTLPFPTRAQTSPPPLTAAERAQREADRVFDVIKFHTIRSKPASEVPPRTSRPPPPRAHSPERPAAAHAATAAPAAAPTDAANAGAVSVNQAAAITTPIAPSAATEAGFAASMPEPEPDAEPEPDEQDEVALRLQNFVAPVLTPALQATLGAGSRLVRVRLTVEPDGKVSHAEAAVSVPRRLAKPATEAILQWQFAPLPQARTADVEISFRRD